jgi:hypothetical protein
VGRHDAGGAHHDVIAERAMTLLAGRRIAKLYAFF